MQSFRGSYANRGSGAQRASSDARARRVLFFSGKKQKPLRFLQSANMDLEQELPCTTN